MIERDKLFAVAFCTWVAGFSIVAVLSLSRCASIPEPSPSPSPLILPKVSSGCECWPGTSPVDKHQTRLTGYYPDASALEGGFHNRYGGDLSTLQAFKAGKAKYVSVAMDKNLGKVKRKLCIASLGSDVPFLVEDTGGAFTGKGWGRLDICVANRTESLKSAVNSTVEVVECK